MHRRFFFYWSGGIFTARVHVIHASMTGHTEVLATAIADGVESTGAQVLLTAAEQTNPDDLVAADGIIWGSSGYFGSCNPKMVTLFDRLGGLWMAGGLQGKVGGVFATTSTMHGGLETVLHALSDAMMHHGMILISNAGQFTPERIKYGCPYGASAVVPTANHLDMASGQPAPGEMQLAFAYGQRVAQYAAVLAGQLQSRQ